MREDSTLKAIKERDIRAEGGGGVDGIISSVYCSRAEDGQLRQYVSHIDGASMRFARSLIRMIQSAKEGKVINHKGHCPAHST